MTVIGTQDFAPDVLAVVVDADPTVTPVDAPRGSLIVFKPGAGLPTYFSKDDDGSTTNVTPLGGSGGGVVAVSSVELSVPTASLDITGFDDTSRLWLLVLSRLAPVTGGSAPRLLLREDGIFRAADYESHTEGSFSSASTYFGTNQIAGAAFLEIAGSIGWSDVAGKAGQVLIWIQDPANTVTRKWIIAEGAFYRTTPVGLTWIDHRGAYNPAASTAEVDALRLSMSSGNLAAGMIGDLYKFNTP